MSRHDQTLTDIREKIYPETKMIDPREIKFKEILRTRDINVIKYKLRYEPERALFTRG